MIVAQRTCAREPAPSTSRTAPTLPATTPPFCLSAPTVLKTAPTFRVFVPTVWVSMPTEPQTAPTGSVFVPTGLDTAPAESKTAPAVLIPVGTFRASLCPFSRLSPLFEPGTKVCSLRPSRQTPAEQPLFRPCKNNLHGDEFLLKRCAVHRSMDLAIRPSAEKGRPDGYRPRQQAPPPPVL